MAAPAAAGGSGSWLPGSVGETIGASDRHSGDLPYAFGCSGGALQASSGGPAAVHPARSLAAAAWRCGATRSTLEMWRATRFAV